MFVMARGSTILRDEFGNSRSAERFSIHSISRESRPILTSPAYDLQRFCGVDDPSLCSRGRETVRIGVEGQLQNRRRYIV